MERQIPFSPPDISETEIANVTEVLKSGWITTGPQTKRFEKNIAAFCGTRRTVCLNSATACLEQTLRLFGIGEGDEVITSAYTYTASASVICHVGAKPVLIDTVQGGFHMDYAKLEQAITKKTKAIIPVDIAGVMCDYDVISKIVSEKKRLFHPASVWQEKLGKILILADGAHSFGAEFCGVKSGNCADFTAFSFHAVKNITTAEGGAVTWKAIPGVEDEEIYKAFMLASLHGQSKDAYAKHQPGAWEYDIVYPAYKNNMTDIMAAIGLGQLARYPELLEKRRMLVSLYEQNINREKVQMLSHENGSCCHLFLTRLIGKNAEERNRFIRDMAERGISCNVHYKPLPMHTAYRNMGFSPQDYPNACETFTNEVTLPLHTKMTEDDVRYVAEWVNCLLK